MSGGEANFRERFLYQLPADVHFELCRVMDGLSDLDWTAFASRVLTDQNSVRLAQRQEQRSDWVLRQWGTRNGRVGQLLDLLERLDLLTPRDLILTWASTLKSPPPAQAPPPASRFDPPPKTWAPLPTLPVLPPDVPDGGRSLPGPAPPPTSLHSHRQRPPQAPPPALSQAPLVASNAASWCGGGGPDGSGVMCWSYEEVHAGTRGFSPALQVGEGGFGVVYRATLRNTDCAVKRFKQDCPLDWKHLKQSFHTEVEKLSKFRHRNIVDLLGFCEGGGSVCLIYSYMENHSLEDQLHREPPALSWPQRVCVVKETSAALQYLHSPPDGHAPLIHGDVKSSNILLDRHLVAKLADFGLARFVSGGPSGASSSKTRTLGRTATIRGTQAYLPLEYLRDGKLGTGVDVYSFGVVLLELLTGRRALERDIKAGDIYLKDLVKEIEESASGSSPAAWRKQLDARLLSGGGAEPAGCMQMVALACSCLDKKIKKRPQMTEVFEKLEDMERLVTQTPRLPSPPASLDSSVTALSQQLSRLGSLAACGPSLTPPHPLHAPSSLPGASPLPSSSPPSFEGPCETDESRGFSQYDLGSQFSQFSGSIGSAGASRPPAAAAPTRSQFDQSSVPTEDQYNFPPASGSAHRWSEELGPSCGDATSQASLPAGTLHSLSPVLMNPSKQRFLEKRSQYEEGRIQTPELLSDDLYAARSEVRGPEESDELDYLPSTRQ